MFDCYKTDWFIALSIVALIYILIDLVSYVGVNLYYRWRATKRVGSEGWYKL